MINKLLTIKAAENVIRLFPPLVVKNEELDEAISKIEKTNAEYSKGATRPAKLNL